MTEALGAAEPSGASEQGLTPIEHRAVSPRSWRQRRASRLRVKQAQEFDVVQTALVQRGETLQTAIDSLAKVQERVPGVLDADSTFRLASADLFVEKVQTVLTRRARTMFIAGTVTSLLATGLLAMIAIYIALHTLKSGESLSDNQLILRITQAISLGAFVIVAVRYLISLARSFFHEAVALLSRRHSIRFGRLFLYLNPTQTNLDALIKAFDWNRGGDSSFLDIRPNELTETPWAIIAKQLGEIANAVSSSKPKKKPEQDSEEESEDGAATG